MKEFARLLFLLRGAAERADSVAGMRLLPFCRGKRCVVSMVDISLSREALCSAAQTRNTHPGERTFHPRAGVLSANDLRTRRRTNRAAMPRSKEVGSSTPASGPLLSVLRTVLHAMLPPCRPRKHVRAPPHPLSTPSPRTQPTLPRQGRAHLPTFPRFIHTRNHAAPRPR